MSGCDIQETCCSRAVEEGNVMVIRQLPGNKISADLLTNAFLLVSASLFFFQNALLEWLGSLRQHSCCFSMLLVTANLNHLSGPTGGG